MAERLARRVALITGIVCSVIAVLLNVTSYWYGDAHLYWLIGHDNVCGRVPATGAHVGPRFLFHMLSLLTAVGPLLDTASEPVRGTSLGRPDLASLTR